MRLSVAGVMLAATCVVAAEAGAQERFTLEGERVAVYNLAGQVRVEPGGGRDVVVEVTRGGPDAGRLTLRRGAREGVQVLAVVYPAGAVVYPAMGGWSNTNLNVRGDGTFGGDQGIFGRGERVTVHGSGGGTRAWADVRVLVPAGHPISINQAVGRVDVVNVDGRVQVKGYASALHASGTRGGLDLDTGSGGIEVANAEGDVRLDTGSGGVKVSGVRSGSLDIDTGSGGVEGGDLALGNLHVDVGSGGVRLDRVSARHLDIDTGSGSVRLGLRGDVEYAKIDTGSGGVVLGVTPDFGAEAEIDTGSGGIHVDVPANVRRASRSHFSGSFGDGNGRLIIDTGSGGVQIVRG